MGLYGEMSNFKGGVAGSSNHPARFEPTPPPTDALRRVRVYTRREASGGAQGRDINGNMVRDYLGGDPVSLVGSNSDKQKPFRSRRLIRRNRNRL